MKSKAIALLLVAVMLLAGFTGCSGKTAADTETRTFMGQVTSIDNNTIKLALVEQARLSDDAKQNANATSTSSTGSDKKPSAPPDGNGNGAPGGNGGTPPARPDGQAPSSSGQTPSSSSSGQTPSSGGQAPAVDSTHSSVASSGGLTLTGKTKEIKVTDSTSVMIDNAGTTTKAALSDIKVGSVLSVTMTDDTVTEIIITSAQTTSPASDNAE